MDHLAHVTEDGKLVMRVLDAWRASVQRLKGLSVIVSIKRVADPTTVDQHGYYRAALLPLAAEEWGWGNPAELHRELKLLHLPGIIPVEKWPRRKFGTDEIFDVPSMADFSREESSAFIQKVIDQMVEAGIRVPPPRGSEPE